MKKCYCCGKNEQQDDSYVCCECETAIAKDVDSDIFKRLMNIQIRCSEESERKYDTARQAMEIAFGERTSFE